MKVVILNCLLDANTLKFTRDDLISRRPYPIRQLSHPMIKTDLKHYGLPVKVYRVGDKQNDKLSIPKDIKNKVKSSESLKSFAKKYIKFNGMKYDQSSNFLLEYYGWRNIKSLIDNIKKYKTYKKTT